MGARDTKSKEREKQAEPSQITELMARMEREIQMLNDEMIEILHRPNTRYELYPNISATIRVYSTAKNEVLNRLILQRADLRIKLQSQDLSSSQEAILGELDKIPHKDDEINCDSWRETFANLKQSVDEEIKESQTVLFPLLMDGFSPEELRVLGVVFKNALNAPSGNISQGETKAA